MAEKQNKSYDFNQIPMLGTVLESLSSAPGTPVNGRKYYDTTLLRARIRENGAWVNMSQTGSELTANKGAASGYASLDGSTKVPIDQLPTGTTSTTVVIGNDTRVANAEQTTNKGVANGYAGLDAATRLATANLPVVLTAAGITGATAASRYAGATASGAPATGTFAVGDYVIDQTGNIYICTVAGSPGTWLAVLRFGATATTAAAGNDSRLSDTRTPSASSITSAMFAAGGIDQAAATASARTLGTGSTQAAAGNDSRLSDTRTPSASSITSAMFAAGGIDQVAGTASARTLGNGSTQAMPGNYRLDQITAPTGPVGMNGQKLTGGAAATVSTDFVILSQLDAASAGIDNKPSARIVLTANDGLTGLAARDGITPVDGDRVLATAQTTASQNGIWIAHSGAWTRATDTITSAAFWMVEEGTVNGGSQWKVATPNPITVGTTALTINQWGAAGTSYTGTTNRVTVTSGVIDISASYVGQASITTLGTITTGVWNGTDIAIADGGTGASTAAAARTNLAAAGGYTALMGAITAGGNVTVTHNLNTLNTVESFRLVATGAKETFQVVNATVNTLTVTSEVAINANDYQVTVVGVG